MTAQGDLFRTRDATLDRLLLVLETQRKIHPELRRPLTWNGARAILRRLRIPIVTAPMLRPAALISQLGTTVLLLDANTPARRHTYFVAHELAHAWLHVDDAGSPVYYRSPCEEHDPRESEAEDLATLMLGGPKFSDRF